MAECPCKKKGDKEMKRRVVITGMGAVTPIGNNTEQMWESVKKGSCGIAPITHYDTSGQKVELAGEIKNLNIDEFIDKKVSISLAASSHRDAIK